MDVPTLNSGAAAASPFSSFSFLLLRGHPNGIPDWTVGFPEAGFFKQAFFLVVGSIILTIIGNYTLKNCTLRGFSNHCLHI